MLGLRSAKHFVRNWALQQPQLFHNCVFLMMKYHEELQQNDIDSASDKKLVMLQNVPNNRIWLLYVK